MVPVRGMSLVSGREIDLISRSSAFFLGSSTRKRQNDWERLVDLHIPLKEVFGNWLIVLQGWWMGKWHT